uniref:OTU domain-containing protein n=1 Tax=Strongyloides papillosus TaxID=174720 RepID=A0A0N5C515_STREA
MTMKAAVVRSEVKKITNIEIFNIIKNSISYLLIATGVAKHFGYDSVEEDIKGHDATFEKCIKKIEEATLNFKKEYSFLSLKVKKNTSSQAYSDKLEDFLSKNNPDFKKIIKKLYSDIEKANLKNTDKNKENPKKDKKRSRKSWKKSIDETDTVHNGPDVKKDKKDDNDSKVDSPKSKDNDVKNKSDNHIQILEVRNLDVAINLIPNKRDMYINNDVLNKDVYKNIVYPCELDIGSNKETHFSLYGKIKNDGHCGFHCMNVISRDTKNGHFEIRREIRKFYKELKNDTNFANSHNWIFQRITKRKINKHFKRVDFFETPAPSRYWCINKTNDNSVKKDNEKGVTDIVFPDISNLCLDQIEEDIRSRLKIRIDEDVKESNVKDVEDVQIEDQTSGESQNSIASNEKAYIPTAYERRILNIQKTPEKVITDDDDGFTHYKYDDCMIPKRLRAENNLRINSKIFNIKKPSTFKNIGFNRNIKLEPRNFGNIFDGTKCKFCGALYFHGEKIGVKCCKKGLYNDSIKMTKNYPETLKQYFSGETHESKVFLQNIRSINYAVSYGQFNFTPRRLGGPYDRGIQPVILQGKAYSKLNINLNKIDNLNQIDIKNNQYFMIGSEEYEAMKVKFSDKNAPAANVIRDAIEISTVQYLEIIFRTFVSEQGLAKEYRRFCDFLKKHENDEEFQKKYFMLRIVQPGPNDDKNEQVPLNPEEIAFIYDSPDGLIPNMDILLAKMPNSANPKEVKFITLNRNHTRIDGLTYTIIFPFGEETWDSSKRAKDPKNYPSRREYFRYNLFFRNDDTILLKAGRLLQQFIIDYYVRIENDITDYAKKINKERKEIMKKFGNVLDNIVDVGIDENEINDNEEIFNPDLEDETA